MRHLSRFRSSPALVVACIALALTLGGTGYAALKLAPNSITTREVKNRSLLAVDFKRGQLPRGARGPAGPAGATGPAGTSNVKWALVRPDGTIVQQSGGLTVASHSGGQYILDFGTPTNAKLIVPRVSCVRRRTTRTT